VVALINRAISANPADPVPRLALIRHYYAVKDLKKAVSVGQEALAVVPDNSEILDALGQSQRAAGEMNQALATYNKYASVFPDRVQPYVRIAELHADNKDLEAAARSLRKALAIKPDFLDAQRGLINLDLGAGRSQQALDMAREVQRQRPKEPIGYLLEGDLSAAKKSWNAAVDAYRNGLKHVQSTEIAIKLHAALSADGKGAEGEKFAAAWMKERPNDRGFRQYIAELAIISGDYARAEGHYRLMVAAEPDNPLLLNNLASVAAQLRRSDALDIAEKANKIAPGEPQVMDTLATILMDKGDFPRALELLSKAAKALPNNPAIRMNYVRALSKAGKKSEARQELEELAKQGNKFPAQAEVTKLLREL